MLLFLQSRNILVNIDFGVFEVAIAGTSVVAALAITGVGVGVGMDVLVVSLIALSGVTVSAVTLLSVFLIILFKSFGLAAGWDFLLFKLSKMDTEVFSVFSGPVLALVLFFLCWAKAAIFDSLVSPSPLSS